MLSLKSGIALFFIALISIIGQMSVHAYAKEGVQVFYLSVALILPLLAYGFGYVDGRDGRKGKGGQR